MKTLKTTLLLTLLCFVVQMSAQDSTATVDKNWQFGGKPGLKWSRNSFSNWAAGGIGSSAIEFDSEAHAYFKNDIVAWKNDLRMSYGFNRRDQEGKRKMVDKLDFRSHYSRTGPNEKFRYSVMFGIKSQFTDGYNYLSSTQRLLQSGCFAPGYVTFDFGLDYIAIKHLNIHFSPLAEKTTIVTESYYERKVVNTYYDGSEPRFFEDVYGEGEPYDQAPTTEQLAPFEALLDSTEVTYGLAWRENSRFETGAGIQIVYDYPEILKNVDYKTRFDVFASYTNFFKPDIDWEVWLSFNFNKYIAFTINTQLMYDSDILFDDNGTKKQKIQFRDFVGVGLSYTLK